MSVLFALAMLLSLIGLVVGLVKPSVVGAKSKKRAASIFGGLTILFFILVAVMPSPETPAPTTVVPEPAVVETSSFDIPSLVGKNIDEIESVIGKAERTFEPTELQEENGPISSEKTFVKDGDDLMISYDKQTRIVVDFFISTDDASGASSDKAHLLEIGNLTQNAPTYSVEFVPAIKDPSVYTGVIVRAN